MFHKNTKDNAVPPPSILSGQISRSQENENLWLVNTVADQLHFYIIKIIQLLKKKNKFYVKNNFQNHLKGQKQKWSAFLQEARSRKLK